MNYKQRVMTSLLLAVTALAGCVTDPGPFEMQRHDSVEKSAEPVRDAAVLPGNSDSAAAIDHRLIATPLFPPITSVYRAFESCVAASVATFKAQAAQILIDEVNALRILDPLRRDLALIRIAQRKQVAKEALYLSLSRCYSTYRRPLFHISLGEYYSAIVAEFLERP